MLGLLQENPDDRPESLFEVIDVFETLVGNLNISNHNYNFFIDTRELEELKRQSIVEDKMTMAQFTNSLLRREFRGCYGYYDVKYQKFVMTGNKLVMECGYEEERQMFYVSYLSKITQIGEILISSGVLKLIVSYHLR